MIPYNEFRMVITIYSTHSSEDPYVFEYLVDFSQTKVSNEQKSKYAEAIFLEGNNNIIFGTQIIFDPNNEVSNSLNYKISLDTSFSAGGSSPSVKPDFGKNVFMALKHLTVALPLKRVV